MSAVERRLARFRAARGRAAAVPLRPSEPPGEAAAPEPAESPDGGGQVSAARCGWGPCGGGGGADV